jgi:peptide chain release factor 1
VGQVLLFFEGREIMPAVKEAPLLAKLEAAAQRVGEIDRRLSDAAVLSQPAQIQKLNKERAELAPQGDLYRELCALLKQSAEAEAMLQDSRAEPAMKDLAREELKELEAKRAELESRAREILIQKDPRDEKNTFIEVRAGTGGDEAALFAAELVRMYTRYAEGRRFRVEVVDSNVTEIGGVKESVLLIEGKGAYSRFKHESGVHRVQRVPATEASGRIHTSTVTVAVMPEAEEVDIQIDAKDLKIDTFCSSGAGGQSVNTTYSAVRITHIPTGVVVTCQDERSQLKNRNKAMRNLRSRILEAEREKQESEIAQQRRSQVGTGDRSEKIRTYNFPQNRVTDHRIGLTLHRLDQVLAGDLDEIIDGLIAADQTLEQDDK